MVLAMADAPALALAESIRASDQGAVRAMLAQLREGEGAPLAERLARERERAEEWQGAGFDTARITSTREQRSSRSGRPGSGTA